VKKIGIAILGGTGYGAGELLRIFVQHPQVEIVSVVSSSSVGKCISSAHPHLNGFYNLDFVAKIDFERLAQFEKCVIFSALPHGVTAEELTKILPQLEELNAIFIDLSADFRLKELAVQKAIYPETKELNPELRNRFVFGLSELEKEKIQSAKFIANPGCLSTASILALAPIVFEIKQDDSEIAIGIDAKTGTSGAGRTPQPNFHHAKRSGNFSAYKILEHRHEAEILQALGDPYGEFIKTAFVPHLLPTTRGIFVSAYLTLPFESSTAQLLDIYSKFYQDCPFVRIVENSPELQNVIGTNFCDISIVARGNQVVVMSALDNLVKGMAGQAIQNMNLICGLEETTGLWSPALGI
jgi:N-acetyl-gamma-glutamyl-phosphate reductase common form